MYVVIREATVKPENRHQADAAREEFAAIRARQPGHRGSLALDTGDGRRVTITAWESEQAQATAAPALLPHAERLLYPHTVEPPRIIYRGTVIADDLTTH